MEELAMPSIVQFPTIIQKAVERADTLYILDIDGNFIYVLKDQRKEAPERTSGTHRQDDGTR